MIQQTSLKLKSQEVNDKEEIEFIIETNNKECNNLIDDLNKFLETLNQSFSQLTKGIRNKYSLEKEIIVNMNSYQINDYLNSTIKLTEYKQSIIKIIQDQIDKLIHSFNNLYEQLQLHFNQQLNVKQLKLMISSFNNYQINDYDVKIAQMRCNQGIELQDIWKIQKALEQLDQSILINPNNQESLSYKGLCLKFLNQYEEAITWSEKALAIDPQHVFHQIQKVNVQGYQINTKKQSLKSTKHQLLIQKCFSLNEKVNVQGYYINTKKQSLK